MPETPVPSNVVALVEQYVHSELDNAKKYENRDPLDESGIWSLHRLASEIYAAGFNDGVRVEDERGRGQFQRFREQT